MINIPCVIFAGGKSSRMGEDKSLLPFAGFTTLTEFQYSRLLKIFTNVYISCKNKDKFSFDANFIEDKKTENTFAPTIAFISIFEHLRADSFFTISVDSPFINEETILKLINADSSEVDATVATTEDKIQPLCGIYHRSLLPAFEKMVEEDKHKLNFLLKNSKTDYVTFKNDNTFLNLNHPHEYQKALTLITS
ncbi:molybdenum cofactor guanylyltransferase MobA [Sulfurimonas sp. SAG-AH-194-C21]|nr:molybdenum cofactor guanylyltransferase MobA [Sulfurimonas sp. SAG-AH-194-C21]MDF1883435.1 molybdenum cofactor guanylyltransferase MobA [Sulfurimonas sp. SAG-AH-194-C21]